MGDHRLSHPRRFRLGILPVALSVAGPLVILASAGMILSEADSRTPPNPIRGDFACEDADIVVTGSSRARTDIDLRQLTAELGLPPHAAATATVHGSSAPVWYAVLKNGIFARGCRPEVVIVYDIADKLFAADVLPDERVRLLSPFLTGDDPLIDARIYKAPRRGWWTRRREQVSALRDAWMTTLTAWATGLMFAPHAGETRVEQGRRILDALFNRVFGGEKLRKVDDPDRVPAVPAGPSSPARRTVLARLPNETFLPDIIALCTKHGAKVLVARAPSPPSRAGAEHTPPSLARGCAGLVERLGGTYVDLRGKDVSDTWYADVRHMNALGRRHVTHALAAHLQDLEWLTPAPPGVAGHALPSPARNPGTTSRRPDITTSLDLLDATVSPRGKPPPLPNPGDIQPFDERVAVFLVPHYQDAGADACEARHLLACCSPLRVTEDGVLLPFPNSPMDEVVRLGHGRYAHTGGHLFLTAPDGSNPVRNGRTYRVVPAPDRFCGSYWLLPGESLVFTRPAPPASEWSQPMTRLEFWARRFSSAPSSIRIRLSCDEQTRLDTTMSEQGMASEPAELSLAPIVPGACRHLVLELRSVPSGGTWAVLWAKLRD